jgi:antitoxin YefM
MAVRRVSFEYAQHHLAELLNAVEDSRTPILVKRRGHEAVALIPAGELRSVLETIHLVRSPRTTQRLLSALQRALQEPR